MNNTETPSPPIKARERSIGFTALANFQSHGKKANHRRQEVINTGRRRTRLAVAAGSIEDRIPSRRR